MRKPEVGATVYLLDVGNAVRQTPQVLKPVKVERVGRKYFTVGEGYDSRQFHLSDWTEKTDYIPGAKLYKSEQEWVDDKESARLCNELWTAFEFGYNRRKVPLDTLRQMHGLLTASVEGDS